MFSFSGKKLLLVAAIFILASCSWLDSEEEKPPLPGERISALELQKNLDPNDTASEAVGFIPAPVWQNDFWPQAGGYPNHAMQNLALNTGELKKIWNADIGAGNQDNLPLTAQPIVFGDKVFTLDTQSQVSAFALQDGKRLWRNTIRPDKEDEQVIGGGLAYANGILYVTNGYNELLALSPESGGIFWRSQLSSPSRAAPTVINNMVFIVTLDNKIMALNAGDGKQIWDYEALSETAGIVGAASPAANKDIVVPVFSSGEIMALHIENGAMAWADDLSPTVKVGGVSALPDIHALPVLDNGKIFAISVGGKMVALNEVTGERIWQKDITGADTPWLAGNYIFLITSNNELIAISSDTGSIRWVKDLSQYGEGDKRDQGFLWNGPILAGERLIITGPEDNLIEINPLDGTLIRRMKLEDTAIVAPVVAQAILLILTQDGTLTAYK